MRVFILLCFCHLTFASTSKISEEAEAKQVAEFHVGSERKLLSSVPGAGWFTKALASIAVSGAVAVTNSGGNTIKVGNIIELKANQIKKLLQITIVGVKNVAGKATKKKAKEILSLVGLVSEGSVKGTKDKRDLKLADFALGFVWQAGFVLDYFATLRNAAIAAACAIKKAGEKALEKIKEKAREWVNAAIKAIPALGDKINSIKAYFGFDPWDGSPGYDDCAQGTNVPDTCVCYISPTGTSCDDGKGNGDKYICVPDEVVVCMPGEKCVNNACEVDVEEVQTDMEAVDESKKDALIDLVKSILKFFARSVTPGTDSKEARTELGASMWKDTMLMLGLPTSDKEKIEMQLAADYGLPLPEPAAPEEAKLAVEASSNVVNTWNLDKSYWLIVLLPAMKVLYDYNTKERTLEVEFDIESTLLQ